VPLHADNEQFYYEMHVEIQRAQVMPSYLENSNHNSLDRTESVRPTYRSRFSSTQILRVKCVLLCDCTYIRHLAEIYREFASQFELQFVQFERNIYHCMIILIL